MRPLHMQTGSYPDWKWKRSNVMESHKNAPKNEKEKTKIVPVWYISQVNNKLSCLQFKRTSYTAKKKWLKVSKTK